jgi:WD40 repeat protein
VKVWNKDNGVVINTFLGHSIDVIDVAFSPDGKFLASAGRDGKMFLWDVEDDLPLGESRPITGSSLLNAAFDSGGNIVTVGLVDGEIAVSTADRTVPIGMAIPKLPEGFSSHLALSSDFKTIALGGLGVIFITDLTSGNLILDQPITGQDEYVTSLAFNPDMGMLASGGCYNRREDGVCPSGIIYLWDTRSGAQIGSPIIGHASWVYGLAFSPDGKTLASGSADDTILLWDIEKREVSGIPFVGHNDQITSLSFSPDGRMLASAAENGEIILWDVQTHQIITMLTQNGSFYLPVHSIAFSPEGENLISADYDGKMMLWDVGPDRWKHATCQRVGRNFTRAEWAYYFPNESYHKTCPQWPPDQ